MSGDWSLSKRRTRWHCDCTLISELVVQTVPAGGHRYGVHPAAVLKPHRGCVAARWAGARPSIAAGVQPGDKEGTTAHEAAADRRDVRGGGATEGAGGADSCRAAGRCCRRNLGFRCFGPALRGSCIPIFWVGSRWMCRCWEWRASWLGWSRGACQPDCIGVLQGRHGQGTSGQHTVFGPPTSVSCRSSACLQGAAASKKKKPARPALKAASQRPTKHQRSIRDMFGGKG